jgi:hypothetical protein
VLNPKVEQRHRALVRERVGLAARWVAEAELQDASTPLQRDQGKLVDEVV